MGKAKDTRPTKVVETEIAEPTSLETPQQKSIDNNLSQNQPEVGELSREVAPLPTIQATKEEWVTKLQSIHTEIQQLRTRLAQLEGDAVANDGAIQACDELIRRLTPSTEEVTDGVS